MAPVPNRVELLGSYGGDETHALSAWTSTHREMTTDRYNRMAAMLNQLANDGHHTPFEKSFLHFLITADVATHIQLIKHRAGVSVNAESARYKEHKIDKFHVPEDWPEAEQERLAQFAKHAFATYHATINRLLAAGLDRKRAKESARYYLPYATQTTMDVAFNFRSFVHFVRLRGDKDAQREIRELSHQMVALVRATSQFDLSLDAFGL